MTVGQGERAREVQAVAAIGFIVAVTAVWWALALWPLPAASPEWLARVRYACFGSLGNGLPNGGGWLLLGLQPVSMLAAVLVIWGPSVRMGFGALASVPLGRAGLILASGALVIGLNAAGVRVARAVSASADGAFEVSDEPLPDTYPRLDRPAPPIGLVDQHGDTVTLERLRGRPALVTFAYAHCTTVCPVVVRDDLAAQRTLGAAAVTVVVVSLDPWRDRPSRLPAIAEQWELEENAFVVSGSVEAVREVLEAWGVPFERDARTGEVTHARLAYVVDANGVLAYAASGGARQMVELIRRSGGES
jgi:cytochrome oxidase Cu insertion factor (SCO1/SenC/PrrC family)